MRVLRFTVPAEYEGRKLLPFLRGHCGLSSRLVTRLKDEPLGMSRQGQLIRTIDTLRAGDVIELRLPADAHPCPAGDVPIDVIYEDNDVLVLNKPPFQPVHPSKGHESGTLANGVAAYLQSKGEFDAFRPVNRLDRNTSGLLVAAKNPYSAAILGGKVEKSYLAFCHGRLAGEQVIDAPIRRKPGFGVTREVGEGGQRAVTHIQSLAQGEAYSCLRVWMETGRTHQIRVHLASIGHPLAGDDMYGGTRQGISRHALHCERLSFLQPITGEHLSFFAPLPEDMRCFAQRSFINDAILFVYT